MTNEFYTYDDPQAHADTCTTCHHLARPPHTCTVLMAHTAREADLEDACVFFDGQLVIVTCENSDAEVHASYFLLQTHVKPATFHGVSESVWVWL